MKFSSVALTLATAGLAVAQPHHHQHRHHHKRGQVVARGGPVVVEYELNGQGISADAVCKGIKEGTLMWADGHAPEGACEAASSMTTPTTTSTPTPTPTPAAFFEQQSSSSSSPSPTPSTTSTTNSASTPASSPSSGGSSGGQGLDREFPDGQIDCGDFPSQYGAIPLDYLGLGGYSGIQYITLWDNLVQDIQTAVTGDKCHPGAMCSYACPPGYQKSQWPSTQGATGQSVGGLHCKDDGKLYLTNTDFSKNLCVQGVGGVHVQNHLGEEVAVCRTDYPGKCDQPNPRWAACV